MIFVEAEFIEGKGRLEWTCPRCEYPRRRNIDSENPDTMFNHRCHKCHLEITVIQKSTWMRRGLPLGLQALMLEPGKMG